jgi:hypothetical protein
MMGALRSRWAVCRVLIRPMFLRRDDVLMGISTVCWERGACFGDCDGHGAGCWCGGWVDGFVEEGAGSL